MAPLEKEINDTYFRASIEGKEELYNKTAELEKKIADYHSDKDKFEFLKKIKESNTLKDEILIRISDKLYNSFVEYQYDKDLSNEIIDLSTKIEEKYATFRAEINGKKINDNKIDDTLFKTNNSNEAKEYWLASKQIGKEVASDVIKLAKLKNNAANQVGYSNFHEMHLLLNELNYSFLDKLFDELDRKISPAFAELKNQIDDVQSKRFGINKSELMPWHFGDKFFQSGPDIFSVNFDPFFETANIENITEQYFESIGLPISDLLNKSDLYEKEGKYQHAYCTDIDRNGDVRVVCNIKPNHKWTGTMLHEFGHAVYDKYISRSLPWILREPAHTFTTEAIAMMFGRFASFPSWIEKATGSKIDNIEKFENNSFLSLRAEQIIFSRWVQVIYRFEKEFYNNPDAELNELWKSLVNKFQLLNYPENRNEPDWAAKIHIALYPAYYQNYMLGELLASQLYYYIKDKVIKSNSRFADFTGEKDVGEYLKNLFFAPGTLYSWDKLIEKSTGEKLNINYYINQFIDISR